MRLESRSLLFVLSLAVSSSPLVAQTFTFSQPKSVLTFPHNTNYTMQSLDLNGDGKTDLAIGTANAQFSVYLGNGTGGFSTPAITANSWDPSPYGPLPMWIDVNGDGFADQVFGFNTYYDPGGMNAAGEFMVAVGDGKGHFTVTTDLNGTLTGSGPSDYSLVPGDFNRDGKIDFALMTGGGSDGNGGSYRPAVTLFLNTGSGKFAQQNPIWLQHGGTMLAGDFNGDGKADLAWIETGIAPGTSKGSYPIFYMYGNGDGTFGPAHTYSIDTVPLALASGDLNGDHKADLVVALAPIVDQHGQPASGSAWRIATLLAKQTGGFYWAHSVSSTTPTTGLELMNLNRDGHLDAIYDLNYLRAGLTGGGWGPHQTVTGQTPPTQPYSFDLPFAPLMKGGLPAVFTTSVDPSQNEHLNVQLNTSR